MGVAIASKLLGGFVFSGGGFVLLWHMLLQEEFEIIYLNSDKDKNINIYVVGKEVESSEQETDTEISKNNYLCKFVGKYYQCEINLVKDFDATKKWIDLSGLEERTEKINNNTLAKAGNIYKLKINQDIDWMQDYQDIDIIPRYSNKNFKYANLKQLFALNSKNTQIDDKTKTKYFIVKATTVSTSSETTTKMTKGGTVGSNTTSTFVSKCASSKENIANTDEGYECEVYNFDSAKGSNLKDLIFQKASKTAGTNVEVEQDKYYLVDLVHEKVTKEISHMKIKQIATTITSTTTNTVSVIVPSKPATGGVGGGTTAGAGVAAAETTTTETQTVTTTKTITLDATTNEIIPAIYIKDIPGTTDKEENIFILKDLTNS